MRAPDPRKLTILMPVFNEERTIEAAIRRVAEQPLPGGLAREIVLVNDGSRDRTWELMRDMPTRFPAVEFVLVNRPVNEGKGAALRDGWERASGDFLVIQDADLEYDPAGYPALLAPLLDGRADVVFGSRFLGPGRAVLPFWRRLANRLLTALSNRYTRLNLSDMWVCYKLFTRAAYTRIRIESPGFGVDPELAMCVARLRLAGDRPARVVEVSIAYTPRSYAEGKKIGWRDAVRAVFQIIRFGRRLN